MHENNVLPRNATVVTDGAFARRQKYELAQFAALLKLVTPSTPTNQKFVSMVNGHEVSLQVLANRPMDCCYIFEITPPKPGTGRAVSPT